ncbi:LysR family transcriptional regulator [Phenylobacterium sp.]|uniref:LysR family transcriptional regulator n=1 Tax=Phenylobacterium sp. TaxID=1871053 RepID=UPI0035663613
MLGDRTFDWNDLKALLAVARGGSTLTAARALGVNQTTVVRRIEALEAAVSLKLMDRTQTGSRLTEAGCELLPDAERIEEAAAAFACRAAAQRRSLAGTIRVTSTEILGSLVITPALADFRRLYPDINVDLILTDRPLDLAAGEADVAIRGGLALPASDLVARKLAAFTVTLYCSRDYAQRRGVPRSAGDLARHALVVGDGHASPLPGVAWVLGQAPGVEPAFRSNTMVSMLNALRMGLGVGPAISLLGDLEPDLVRCFSIPGMSPGTWVVASPELKDTPRVRAFIDFIVPHFAATRRTLEATGAALVRKNDAWLASIGADLTTA